MSFNEFINNNGFNLYRGNIGSNKIHQDKLEYEVNELKSQIINLKEEIITYDKIIDINKEGINNISVSKNSKILNPKKNITGYNHKEVEKLIEYSKSLEINNEIYKIENLKTTNYLESLEKENISFKNNTELINKNIIIKEQQETINKQKTLITSLLKTIDKWKKGFNKLCKAIDCILHRKPMEYAEDYENLADKIINKNNNKNENIDKKI